MDIHLNRNSPTPLYLQIKNSIRNKIISGELQTGFKLPSERQLAKKLNIHRNTVIKAYDALAQESLIFSSRTAPRGYFVGNGFEETTLKKAPSRQLFSPLDKTIKYEFLNAQNVFQYFYNSSFLTESIAFAGLVMNPEVLPIPHLKEILGEIIRSEDLEAFWYCDPRGSERLRTSLVKMLFNRNIYVSPNNIQVVSETFDAIMNISSMYIEQGDYVIVEEPACPATVNIFINAGATTIFVPMDEEGISMPILEQMIKKYSPKLIYTMPTNHNPTSINMSIKRRKTFLQCVSQYGIPIIEDDSQHEFNYTDTQLPSLYSLDNTNSVIYIDSSTLAFFPGARVGYLVAPESVIHTYKRIVNKDQVFFNSLSQYLWSKFIEYGYYEKHQAFLMDYYKKKRDLMCSQLGTIKDLSFKKPDGGLVIWCKLPEYINERSLVYCAEKKGLLLMPGFAFFPYGNQGDGYLRISFAAPTDEQIVEGVKILSKAIENCKLIEK